MLVTNCATVERLCRDAWEASQLQSKDEIDADVSGYEIGSDFYDDASGTWAKTDAKKAGQESVITRIATEKPFQVN